MKSYIYHDIEGTIRAIVTMDAPEGAGMMLKAKPGILVAEVEGLGFKSDRLTVAELQELTEHSKASLKIPINKLTKKR